ncbi:MAG: right-handed parallel beta-helix repeat-containing protein [Oleispira antarctica]|nr:right-handed parallel beta-helix repeat-containing protein [Oleispira antarctica]MBQ0794262.1 right-handed parallel beta-helix repeat-containing protein [Oleispira antarctica]
MKSSTPSMKLGLASAIAVAALGMTGCGGDDSSSSSKSTSNLIDPCLNADCTNSGFILPSNAIYVSADAADGTDLKNALITALTDIPDNSVIVLPKGSFIVSSSITVTDATGITITGHGMTETKLDFSSAPDDDGFKFAGGTDITIRDLGVYEAPKNAIKADGVNGIHITYTSAVWETDLEEGGGNNGAYGLYPVSSQNVLMENNYSKGSADAGIYVGQSNNIVVRNNIAEHNVAGIEIENSNKADVYNNVAFDNSAGILSFDLPGLPQGYGGGVRIFNNNTFDNNTTNVGAGAVSLAPSGTGILIFATSDVEIYNNTIADNDTAGIEIASYFLADDDVANYGTNYGATMANGWSPLIKNINIHDNTFKDNSLASPPKTGLLEDIIAGYQSAFNSTGSAQTAPAIIYGGIGELLSNAGQLTGFDALVGAEAKADGVDYDAYAAGDLICSHSNINNNNKNTLNSNDLNVGLVYGTDATDTNNWNAAGTAPEATLRIDLIENNTLLDCTLERLPPAVVTIKGTKYGCTADDLNLAACSL